MNPATQSPNLSRVMLNRLAELLTLQATLAQQQARADELTASLTHELFPDATPGSFTDGQGVTVTLTETRGFPEVTDESLNEVMPLMPVEFRQLGALIVYRPQVVAKAYATLEGENRATFEKACRFNRTSRLNIQIADTVDLTPEIVAGGPPGKIAGRPRKSVHKKKVASKLRKKVVKKSVPKKKIRR